MKILQLCKKLPFPIKDGECLAITELGKSISHAGAAIHMLAMDTSRHPGSVSSQLKAIYPEIRVVPVDNQIKVLPAFLNLFSSESYHISRFVSNDYSRVLEEMLKENEYDIVQLETVYLAPYIFVIRKNSNAKVVLRAHNIEHKIWERIASNERSGIKRMYLRHLAKKLKNYELSALNGVDLLAAISGKDGESFRELGFEGDLKVVPLGIDGSNYIPNEEVFDESVKMGFIGSLDWIPNQEGLQWFLERIWPSLISKFSNLELHIAGRNAPGWIRDLKSPGVYYHGEVP
ncbi:MAG: glycosyltransferase, partial [Saprospiraceae bacterium]|nr:glycosyltransferase [Saprospiraceae bacterium]